MTDEGAFRRDYADYVATLRASFDARRVAWQSELEAIADPAARQRFLAATPEPQLSIPSIERFITGRNRRLAFQNLAIGVPAEQIIADLRMSRLQLDQATAFVAKKITEHQVLRRQPPIPCDSLAAIRWNRRALLAALSRIGDLDLSSDLILGKITVQAMDHPEMIEGASRRMSEAY